MICDLYTHPERNPRDLRTRQRSEFGDRQILMRSIRTLDQFKLYLISSQSLELLP